MITRTVKSTFAETMVFNGTEMNTLPINVPDGLNADSAIKWLRKRLETDNFRIVAVSDVYVTEELRGITEEDFMKYSIPLDPETRKPL